MGKMLYWLDQYTDETVPCGPRLEEWAKWLSECGPDDDFRTTPVKNGERFTVTVAERFDAVAEWFPDDDGGEWRIEPDLSHDWAAITFGEGEGWDADSIGGGAQDLLADVPYTDRDTPVTLALICDRPSIEVEYRDGALHEVCSATAPADGAKA